MKGRLQIPIFLQQATPGLGLLAEYNRLQWLLCMLHDSQWGLDFWACKLCKM